MKKTIISCTGLIMALLCTSCFRNDTRVGEYHVPMMKSQECLNVLSAKLRGIEGVMDVQADFNTQTVSVTFDGLKAALKNIEFVIAGSGYDVNDTPGNPAAKAELPASCR
jgi:copper chaperone CopZ